MQLGKQWSDAILAVCVLLVERSPLLMSSCQQHVFKLLHPCAMTWLQAYHQLLLAGTLLNAGLCAFLWRYGQISATACFLPLVLYLLC